MMEESFKGLKAMRAETHLDDDGAHWYWNRSTIVLQGTEYGLSFEF